MNKNKELLAVSLDQKRFSEVRIPEQLGRRFKRGAFTPRGATATGGIRVSSISHQEHLRTTGVRWPIGRRLQAQVFFR